MRGLLHKDNVNEAYYPFFRTTKRYVNLRGGSGSSKSWSVAQKVLSWVLNPNGDKEKVLVLRKIASTLRNSVYSLLLAQIKMYNLNVRVRASTLSFIAENGNEIILAGLNDPEKIKSISGITKIWIEEATEFIEEDFNELDRRLRGHVDSYYQIILSFNPIHEKHWIKKRFWDSVEEGGRYNPEKMFNLVTTFNDNKFIDEDYKSTMREIPPEHGDYRIYVLGEWGVELNDNAWLYSFKYDEHIKEDIPFLPTYEVYLSFDFNKDPLTCTAWQMSPNKGQKDSFVYAFKEFGGKKSLEDLCHVIKGTFPNSVIYVTGDSSGNTEGVVGYRSIHDSAYSLIRTYLGLSDIQMQPNKFNLHYENSRILMNLMLSRYPNFYISKKGCPNFINDCTIARVDTDSNLSLIHI